MIAGAALTVCLSKGEKNVAVKIGTFLNEESLDLIVILLKIKLALLCSLTEFGILLVLEICFSWLTASLSKCDVRLKYTWRNYILLTPLSQGETKWGIQLHVTGTARREKVTRPFSIDTFGHSLPNSPYLSRANMQNPDRKKTQLYYLLEKENLSCFKT